jgi:hypothetical protein
MNPTNDRGLASGCRYTHETVEGGYEALDGIADRLHGHGLASDVIELLVVDEHRQEIRRPRLQ